jgi:hypothetical protein
MWSSLQSARDDVRHLRLAGSQKPLHACMSAQSQVDTNEQQCTQQHTVLSAAVSNESTEVAVACLLCRYEMVCAQGGQIVCDAALAAAVVAEWNSMAAAAAAPTEAPCSASPTVAAAAASGCSQGTLGGSDTEQQLPLDLQPVSISSSISPFVEAGGPSSMFSRSAAGSYLPMLLEHNDEVAAGPAGNAAAGSNTGSVAAGSNTAAVGTGSSISPKESPAAAAAAGVGHSQPVQIPQGGKRAMSELHQQQQQQHWYFSPPGNALQVVGSAPAAPRASAAAAGDSAAVAGSSAPRTNSQGVRTSPSTGGLTSWLAAGSKASFVLKGAGGGRRKSAAGRGLRLLQQRAAQHRPVQLVMPAVPTALPCDLCVPHLPSEAFGELRSGIPVAVLESCLTMVKYPGAT